MKGLLMVARREISVRGKTKGYLIGLAVSCLLIVGVILLPTLLGGDDNYKIAVTGTNATEIGEAVTELGKNDTEDTVTVTNVDTVDEARKLVDDGDVDAAIIDDKTLIADGEVSSQLSIIIDTAHNNVVSAQQLSEAGLDPDTVADALNVTPLERENIGGDNNAARAGIAIFIVIIMFFFLMSPTMYVAMGVVEEKSSRIVEILLSTLRTWQLLGGKILGLGVLGFVNIVAIALTGFVTASAVGFLPSLPPGLGTTIWSVLGWWVLGYAFYAALAGALASLVSRQEDMSSTLTPMTMLLTGSYVVAFISVTDPNAAFTHILSYVPPFSALIMPVRQASSDIPLWQTSLSVLAMIIATVGIMFLAATIYKRSIMRMGSKVKLTELFQKEK